MMLPAIRFDRVSVLRLAPNIGNVVYRVYDEEGLVYVGATTEPRNRLLRHLRTAMPGDWVELEFCRTTTAMARREREAMANEQPRLATVARRHGTWRARRSS